MGYIKFCLKKEEDKEEREEKGGPKGFYGNRVAGVISLHPSGLPEDSPLGDWRHSPEVPVSLALRMRTNLPTCFSQVQR